MKPSNQKKFERKLGGKERLPRKAKKDLKKAEAIMSNPYGSYNEELKKVAKEFGISEDVANDVVYLRTRSRWRQDLEQQIIDAAKAGNPISSDDIMTGEWPYGEKDVRRAKISAGLDKLIKELKDNENLPRV